MNKSISKAIIIISSLSIASFGSCKKKGSNNSPNNPTLTYQDCIGLRSTNSIETIKDGNWDDPSTWSTGSVPSINDNIVIKHNIDFPNNNTTATFTHNADITIELNASARFNTNPNGSASGFGFELSNSTFIVEGDFSTNEDVLLSSVNTTFGLSADIYIGDDLKLEGNTEITNNSTACGSFAIGDDIYLYGTDVLINGDNNIALGQDPNNSTTSTPGNTAADHIALFDGASINQITTGVVYDCTTLPLSLISFNGTWAINTEYVELNFKTSSELNVDHFIIKHLAPCQEFIEENFETVDQINATGNNSNQTQSYSSSVDVFEGGTHYFRLYERTIDGVITPYETISVKVGV